MTKTTTTQELDANIPESAVSTRSQSGVNLSYLTGAYVINRLNQVLGQGNWAYKIDQLKPVFEGKITQASGKEVFTVSYTAMCSLIANIDGKTVEFTDVGFGDGTDARNPGKGHELASKEAATDALKRAAKNLGISMGLGLYFKGEEYVGEAEPTNVTPLKTKAAPAEAPKAAPKRKAPTRDLVKAAFNVLQSQGKVTAPDFKAKFLNNRKVDELDDAAIETAFNQIKTNFPDLAL